MHLTNLAKRRILITGGTGFLGSHLCDYLTNHGCLEVVGTGRSYCDLRKGWQIRAMLAEIEPEIVIHLAGVGGGIRANLQAPGQFFYENALMGIQLMEECRRMGVRKFVGIGSVASYPKFSPIPFQEKTLWNGYPDETTAPYSLAKKMLLVQAQAYRQQYSFPAITLLPVNLYGPRDNFEPQASTVVPALIRKFIEAREAHGEFVELWGTGGATREFLFVKDAAEAIALAADRYNAAAPLNLGSGREVSICALAKMIQKLCRFSGEIRWDRSQPNGQPRRCVDTTRAAREIDFVARTDLEDGLIETIKWYEKEQQHSSTSRQKTVAANCVNRPSLPTCVNRE